MRLEARRWAAATIHRAKVVLIAMALVASILLLVVGSWPLKILVVLAFVRGLFASDLIALRNARRRRIAELTSLT